MGKIDASRMLELLSECPRQPVLRFFLCDGDIFPHLAQQSLNSGLSPVVFRGEGAFRDAMNSAGTASLFEPSPPGIIILEEKLTAKQWDQALREFQRLPRPAEATLYVFGTSAQRRIVDEEAVTKIGEYYLCYSPTGAEVMRCLQVLSKRRANLVARYSSTQIVEVLSQIVEYYGVDLFAVDSHLERMDKLGCSVEEALSGQTEASAFAVVDALANGKAGLVELRIQQCLLSGVECSAIVALVSRFLIQLATVNAALAKNNNVAAAFKTLNIPFPAQDKIKMGLKHISKEKVVQFLYLLPELEREAKIQKRAHEWIAAEFLALLQ